MNLKRALILATATALTACGSSHKLLARVTLDRTATRAYLVSNVNVFDGEASLGPRDVRVQDGLVQAVAEAGTLKPETGDQQIDGTGRTLMPGLVDAHAHLESHGEAIWDLGLPKLDDIAQAYVYAGVTTIILMTGNEEHVKLEQRAASGELIMPRLYRSGPRLTAPDGFPMNLMRALLIWPLSSMVINKAMRSATTADEARGWVEETHKELAPPFYKLTCDAFPPGTPKLTQEAMTAAIQHANKLGMRPTAHIGAPDDALIAAEAGLALFAHPPTSALFTPEQLARLAELKVPFASTQRFLTASNHVGADKGTPLDREIVSAAMLDEFSNRPKDFKYPTVPPEMNADELLARYEKNLRENVFALWKAGVPIFVGTDAGSPGVFPGSAIQRELVLLVAAGIPVIDVLKAATSAPADFLDKSHSYGRVAVGQRADLLLVNGDPTLDITATGSIVEVFQAGHRLTRTLEKP